MNTAGYGDIHPSNPLETLFIILFIYVACIIFGYTLNSIGIILENISKSQKEYLKEVNLVNNFMRENNISFDLRIRVRKYFEHIWTEEKVHKKKEQTDVLKKLFQRNLSVGLSLS
jgi:Ion channel